MSETINIKFSIVQDRLDKENDTFHLGLAPLLAGKGKIYLTINTDSSAFIKDVEINVPGDAIRFHRLRDSNPFSFEYDGNTTDVDNPNFPKHVSAFVSYADSDDSFKKVALGSINLSALSDSSFLKPSDTFYMEAWLFSVTNQANYVRPVIYVPSDVEIDLHSVWENDVHRPDSHFIVYYLVGGKVTTEYKRFNSDKTILELGKLPAGGSFLLSLGAPDIGENTGGDDIILEVGPPPYDSRGIIKRFLYWLKRFFS